MCEYAGYPIAPGDAHLGLGLAVGMESLDLRPSTEQEISTSSRILRQGSALLHGECERFFVADEVIGGTTTPGGSYAIVLITAGTGVVRTATSQLPVSAGDGIVVPAAVDAWQLEGDARAIAFRGPSPTAAAP